MNNNIYYDIEKQDVFHSFQGFQFFDTLYLVPDFTNQPTTAVLLPLLNEGNYRPRVLLAGAVWTLISDPEIGPGITNAWQHTAPCILRLSPNGMPVTIHHFCNGTLLSTDGVVISDFTYTENQGVKSVEIYHPPLLGQLYSWTTRAAVNETRNYHSTAFLMPDGRLWTGGSENEDVTTPQYPVGVPKLAVETTNGYLTLLLFDTEATDTVVLLRGGKIAYVICRSEAYWEFAGDFDFHGAMDGEVWNESKLEETVFI